MRPAAAAATAGARTHPLPLAGWRAHLVAFGVAVAALLLLFRRDLRDVATIWWTASSYEHCLAILPVLAWLVWLRREALAGTTPAAWAPPLLWVAAGAAGWLLGAAAMVAVARHLGVAMMMQGMIATLLGRAATRLLIFPLSYALFLVPAGDVLVPPLQTLTARMCMVLLAIVRVPAVLDGVFIATPGGWFRVAEACSGAKFLIAMAALGVLVAQLGFRSWRRRTGFVALCLVAPVLANGVRAFSTIWVAQAIGADRAGSVDHLVYGWIFFALVIAAVLAIGSRFFDRDAVAAPRPTRTAPGATLPLVPATLAALAIAAAAPGWALIAARAGDGTLAALTVPPAVAGWTPVAGAGDWRPRFDGADRIRVWRYRDAAGATADVAAALYAGQGEGRMLVGYGHGAADPDGVWSWAADVAAPPGWRGEWIEATGRPSRLAFTGYRAGGVATTSPARVKLATLAVRLRGGDARAGALLVSSADPAAARRLALAVGDPGAALGRLFDGR